VKAPLVDSFGRVHTYLRVSVTDRCNYRCVYCLPADGVTWQPRDQLLDYDELERLIRLFASMGIEKIRLTGGEPTIRRHICRLVEAIANIDGITDLAMTTNGHTLVRTAERLKRAGLRRINLSLDTLDPVRFRDLTRGGNLRRVLDGVAAARAVGLRPIRVNAVLLRGENDDEIDALVDWAAAAEGDIELRFIEYMPFEARWYRCIPAREVLAHLRERFTVTALDGSGRASGPARMMVIEETGLRVGFISPLSARFCGACNRLRLQADGFLRTCLAHDGTPSLRDLLRGGATDGDLEAEIRRMVAGKLEGHDCDETGGTPFAGVMTGIGG